MVIRVKPDSCSNCGSPNLTKIGRRYNQGFWVQRFRCKDCLVSCCDRLDEFKRMRSDDEFIEETIRLFDHGLSSYQIEEKLNHQVEHGSIIKWIKKYRNNPRFKLNGSHRKDVREKISNTLRTKNHIHKWNSRISNESQFASSRIRFYQICSCGLSKTVVLE